jgi:hypothetical protein
MRLVLRMTACGRLVLRMTAYVWLVAGVLLVLTPRLAAAV